MQINSRWAKVLGKERWQKLGEPCTNVRTGAWILSQCVRRHGYNWKAVGCYHSNTPGKRERYAGRIASLIAGKSTTGGQNRLQSSLSSDPAPAPDPWSDVFGKSL